MGVDAAWGWCVAFSTDGISWEMHPENPVLPGADARTQFSAAAAGPPSARPQPGSRLPCAALLATPHATAPGGPRLFWPASRLQAGQPRPAGLRPILDDLHMDEVLHAMRESRLQNCELAARRLAGDAPLWSCIFRGAH